MFGDALDDWRRRASPASADFAAFLDVAADLDLASAGRATDRFLSHGSYPLDGRQTYRGGVWTGELRPLDQHDVAEDCSHGTLPEDAQGVGLVEAAGGALDHWVVLRKGRIANYQIVAPTTWNFSPRDADGKPGALEQALDGLRFAATRGGVLIVQHVVRSFDPCTVRTVH